MRATMAGIELQETTFVDLVTFRRDGTPVSTPMLSTAVGDTLLLRTHHTAGKLKRLRNNAAVEVAPSKGKRRVGPVERATARVLPAAENARCLDLLHRRHGLVGRVATLVRHVRGLQDVFIEVQLA